MAELTTPNGNYAWQLSMPIINMSERERYEAIGFIEAILRTDPPSRKNLNFAYRLKVLRATLPRRTKPNKLKATQLPLFHIKRERV